VILAAIAWTLPTTSGERVTAAITLQQLTPGPDRTVAATVRLDPGDAADGALWFMQTSWQGGGSVIAPLREIAPGVWRTTKPMPVSGDWKSLLRLHHGNVIDGLPVYLPADPAIPAAAVPARASLQRTFSLDRHILQRETKTGVAGWLTLAAYLTVLAIALAMAAGLGWGLSRLRGGLRPPPPASPDPGATRGERPHERGRGREAATA
jgi:hypothetical protein